MGSFGMSASSAPTSTPAYVSPTAPPLPEHGAASASLVVRPDVVMLTFVLRTVAEDADVGVALLQQSIKSLEPRFAEVVPKDALKTRMRGTVLARAPRYRTSKKAKGEGVPEMDPFAVSVQGTFEIALAPTQDYWSRSHEVARLSALAATITSATNAEGSAFTATFGDAEPHVRDRESFRDELVKKWAARKRQSARDVKSGEVAITPESCRLAGDITEHLVSIEEIELSLPADCRLSSAPQP